MGGLRSILGRWAWRSKTAGTLRYAPPNPAPGETPHQAEMRERRQRQWARTPPFRDPGEGSAARPLAVAHGIRRRQGLDVVCDQAPRPVALTDHPPLDMEALVEHHETHDPTPLHTVLSAAGSQRKAAEALGLNLSTFQRRLAKEQADACLSGFHP